VASLSIAQLPFWFLCSSPFSRDPLADVCWAILERDVVRFAAAKKTDSVLISVTTSPFAALVIFSIQPLLRILIPVASVTHACNGNHGAIGKLLILCVLVAIEMAKGSPLAKFCTKLFSALPREVLKPLVVLRGI
jgi:hypothetical protein